LLDQINPKLQKSVKEIVDGQQRIRTIVEFANNELTMNNKSERFHGMKYTDLSEDSQQIFLGYTLTIEQLLNATDDDVIDIFARLNSYTVALNAAEKRHAKFQTELKFFVRRMSVKFRWFVEKYGIFTIKQRFRMQDDEFFAELTRLVVEGIQDGGAEKITKFYQVTSDSIFNDQKQKAVEDTLDQIIHYLDSDLGVFLKGPLGKHYQVYCLSAALLYIQKKIPRVHGLPGLNNFGTHDVIVNRLVQLESDIDEERNTEFVKASSATTQRIATRLVRIRSFIEALGE
jgi:uncharacterized protein with ParB-like and HNH nuclease domain